MAEVASPCIGICAVRAGTRLCDGCLRTVEEITEWQDAGDERRRAILAAVAERRRQRPGIPAEPRTQTPRG